MSILPNPLNVANRSLHGPTVRQGIHVDPLLHLPLRISAAYVFFDESLCDRKTAARQPVQYTGTPLSCG